jgi:hypothetical protein
MEKLQLFASAKNPRLQLMALASRAGELVVKRAFWKTAWKVVYRRALYWEDFKKKSVL